MERHISEEQAKAELEKVVEVTDIKSLLLGEAHWQQNFLKDYRILHAQLKEGDELKIEIGRGLDEKDYSLGFNIVLYQQNAAKKIVNHFTRGCSSGDKLLYP